MRKKNIGVIVVGVIIVILAVITYVCFAISNKKNANKDVNSSDIDIYNENNQPNVENIDDSNKEDVILDNKVDVVDINSNSRPYAIVVNNTPVAVKVQEGLNRAYLIYEVPTEGNTSRLIALYKDIPDGLVVGTIRSARHNFIDFALESDAIFCCFGWSHYAEGDLKNGSIDYLQGLYGGPYYRNNPEGLATEHTAYTTLSGLTAEVKARGIRQTSNNSILLNYNTTDTQLSSSKNSKVANTVIIPYGAAPQITTFKYNKDTKMYTRYENGIACVDHNTKEEVTTKNIIVQKIGYSMCSDNYYWNLNTIGSGEGSYITNGYAVDITWKKDSRQGKTKYMYKLGTIIDGEDVSGKEISVSDGRTFIEVQTSNQPLTIQ